MRIAVLLLAGLTACASGPQSTATPPRDGSQASQLHQEIESQLDFKFDAAVFVLDGTASIAGATRRRYSFDSITKTIVALELALLDGSGTVRMSDHVGSIFDAGRNGGITLEQLATHTAGLPRLAPNADHWPNFDPRNPYAGYTSEMALDALRSLKRSDKNEYSNFGYQLLGIALEKATGESLTALSERLVFAPAGMTEAAVQTGKSDLPDGLRHGRRVPAWDELLGGAGAASGTISDLVAYSNLMIDPPAAMHAAVERALGLAWVRTGDLTWHNGGSYGYKSLIALDLGHRRAAGYLAASGDLDESAERAVFEFLKKSRG